MWLGVRLSQVAILAGDFLLARASVSLAALRNSDVIQLLSQVIEDLVSGEIMQVKFLQKCSSGCKWKTNPRWTNRGRCIHIPLRHSPGVDCSTAQN